MEPLDNKTIDACAKQVDEVIKDHIRAIDDKMKIVPDLQKSLLSVIDFLSADLQNHLQALKTEEDSDGTASL